MSAGDLKRECLLTAEEVVRRERAGERFVIAATPDFLRRVEEVRKTFVIDHVPASWSGTQRDCGWVRIVTHG